MTHARAILRLYQADHKAAIYQAWDDGAINVLGVLPTGVGKTVIFSDIIHDHVGASCAIAHRQELVMQISVALARDHVRHRIVGPTSVVRLCVAAHMLETGRSYYDPGAACAVAGVDTLVRRQEALKSWAESVTLWVQDEGHHVLRANKWGMAARMFPNARGLGVTATAFRADGRGLGRHADGVYDILVEGIGMREAIDLGYLAEYRIFAPPLDFDRATVPTSRTTGDFNPKSLKQAVRKSQIIGDVVGHYLKLTPGKQGITFATDVETATDISGRFNQAGVPAAVVSAKTSDRVRVSDFRKFQNGELKQLVNVDIFGEGVDVPAIEVISMARPTQSLTLYIQQFGRGLRPLEGKTHGIVIDHVGNVIEHGLPDAPRVWSLDRRQKRKTKPDGIPVRACPSCTAVFERIYRACPFCGFVPVPMARSGPEYVDGDLNELTPDVLAIMRGEIAHVDLDKEAYRAELAAKFTPPLGQLAHVKRHVQRQEAQVTLRDQIAWWAGYQRAAGRPDSESYRRFYHSFGVDVMTAQTLKTTEALALADVVGVATTECVIEREIVK